MKYGAPKDFDRIAKEFHVDYAFTRPAPPLSAVLQGRSGGRYHGGLLKIYGKGHGPQTG